MLNATVNDAALTSFAVLSDGYQIAIGYDNGAVILFSGRYLQEVSNTPIRNAAYTTLQTSHAHPVTSLHFCEIPSKKTSDRLIRLFAVMDTPDIPAIDLSQGDADAASSQRPPDPGINGDDPKFAGVLIFDTSVTLGSAPGNTNDFVPGPRHPVRVLDERGAPAHCASFMRGLSELVVARSEAVYNYSIEDRGGALAISGDKQCICAGELVVVLIGSYFYFFSLYSCCSSFLCCVLFYLKHILLPSARSDIVGSIILSKPISSHALWIVI